MVMPNFNEKEPEICGYIDGYYEIPPFTNQSLYYAQRHFVEYMYGYDDGLMDNYLNKLEMVENYE